MKKTSGIFIILFILAGVCFAGSKGPIRIAIVDDEAIENGKWPLHNKFFMERPAKWYQEALKGPEYKTTLLKPEQLLDSSIVNKGNFDILIFNGICRVPFEIHENQFPLVLASFMKDGGHVIRTVGGPCVLYDKKKHKWLTREDYDKTHEEKWPWRTVSAAFPTFNIGGRGTGGGYLNVEPHLNPQLKKLVPQLPEKLTFPRGNWPSTVMKRWGPGTGFKDTLMVPLYQTKIKDKKGNEQIAGPVWIVRYHDRRFNGATMILHTYRCWASKEDIPVFSREDGDKILKALIRLCFERLPGEKNASYYEKKLLLKDETLGKDYIKLIHRITACQQKALYKGKIEEVEKWTEVKKKLEKEMDYLLIAKAKVFSGDPSEKEISNLLSQVKKQKQETKRLLSSFPKENMNYPPTSFLFSTQGGIPDFPACIEILNIAKETGINVFSYGYYEFFADYLYKRFGGKVAGWIGSGGHHRGISKIPCAIFDPRTKKNKEYKGNNWLYDEETYQKVIDSNEKRVKKLKHKERIAVCHLPNEIHLRFNHGWGERAMLLFRKYLKKQYGAIDKVNEIWQTNYKDFSEIVVPIKVPDTQKEQAYWEDWTLFRDHFFSRYVKELYAMAKKYLPGIPVLSRYMGMGVSPVGGVNFSVLNQYCDINGNHSGSYKDLYTQDWVNRIGRKPFYNSEYNFHKYHKDTAINYVKKLRRDLWHGTSNGQIGFQFFPWYWAHVPFFESYSFLESDLSPRMVTWELKDFIHKSGKWSDIVRHGKSAEKAEVAFLWSDTSRRHQSHSFGSFPGWFEAEGLNALFRNIHVEREVLTELDIRKGDIPACIKLIIIPESAYFYPETYSALSEFIKRGGWLFALNSAGAFYDNRGKEDFTFYTIADIIPKEIPRPKALLYGDKTITEFGTTPKWLGWKDLKGSAEILVKSDRNYPLVIRIPQNKGGIVFSSFPIGTLYSGLTKHGLLPLKPADTAVAIQDIVQDILSSLDIQPTAKTNPLVEVHPWYYKGEKYLVAANLQLNKGGVFSVELPYSAKEVYDLLNETSIPVKLEDNKTTFKIYLAKSDGLVLRIRE